MPNNIPAIPVYRIILAEPLEGIFFENSKKNPATVIHNNTQPVIAQTAMRAAGVYEGGDHQQAPKYQDSEQKEMSFYHR